MLGALMETPARNDTKPGSYRYETLMAVIDGVLTPREAARRLDTNEAHVREWAKLLAARAASRRRQEMLARQAARRSTVAIALVVGATLGVAVWGTQEAWTKMHRESPTVSSQP